MGRLLAETSPSVYRHLDRLEADPSLYATPWFLTIFAANFPLGFVARVMDLIILEASLAPVIKIAVCLLLEVEPNIAAAHNLEELMIVMKEKLPNLSCDRLEDVIRQAGSLNINRQLNVYEIEFSVLQEEQTNVKCQTEKLKCDIEVKTRELEAARAEIASLQKRLQQTEAVVRVRQVTDNNNKPHPSSSEDVLFKVVAAVEALSTQVPENIRIKLEEIANIGKESWFRNLNFQKDLEDFDNLHDLSDEVIVDNDDNNYDSDTNDVDDAEDNFTWAGKILKLSRSPTFGSFFGS